MRSSLTLLYDWLAHRIRNKILFSVLAVFIIIYGATLSYTYNHIKEDLLESARQEALSTTQVLAVTLYSSYEIEYDSREIQSYIVNAMKYKSNLLEINVLDRNLEIVSSTNDDNLFETATAQKYAAALENTSSVILLTEGAEPFINIVHPVSAGLSRDKKTMHGAPWR